MTHRLSIEHKESIDHQDFSNYIMFFDIDGTLIEWWYNLDWASTFDEYFEQNKSVITQFKQKIDWLSQKWMSFWISTGRSISDAVALAKKYFPKNVYEKMEIIWECWVSYLQDWKIQTSIIEKWFHQEREMIQWFSQKISEIWWSYEEWKINIISINPPQWVRTDDFLGQMQAFLPHLDHTEILTSSSAIDFLPRWIDKFTTIQWLVSSKKIIYAWDSGNDRLSLQHSDIAIAPSNATLAIKNLVQSKANFILSSEREIHWINTALRAFIS